MERTGQGVSRVGKLVIGAILIVILFFALCFRTVGVGQVGVLTSFGHVKSIQQSGTLIKGPWPFEHLAKFNIQTQKDQTNAAASSADLQDVNVTLVTNYHIDNTRVGDLYRTVGTKYKASIIDPAIQESIKATTAEFQVGDLITKRPQLKVDALAALRKRLAPRGIVVEDISITNLSFSADYTKAIEQKQVAQQQAEQAQYNVQKATLDAQANQVQQAALTPEILEQQAIAKWNGIMPTTTANGSTVFNIPVGK